MNHLTYPVVAHVACIVIVAEKYEVLEWYVRKLLRPRKIWLSSKTL